MTQMIWSGQGPVMIGRYDPDNGRPDSGYLVDLYRVGCGTSALTTSLSRNKKTLTESCSGQRLPLKTLETGKSLSVKLDLYQFSGRTLAAALLATMVEKAAGTVTAEQLPELAVGDYFTLRHPHVSSVVIEDSTAGTPLVYVAGTHYELEDAGHARFRLIAHPAAHVEPVRVDYAYGEHLNLAAFTATNVERGVIFNGINQDGQRARLIIPRIDMGLDGDFGWITSEEATLSLSGDTLYVPELATDADFGPFMRVDALPV